MIKTALWGALFGVLAMAFFAGFLLLSMMAGLYIAGALGLSEAWGMFFCALFVLMGIGAFTNLAEEAAKREKQ